jgi:hypothetical protein
MIRFGNQSRRKNPQIRRMGSQGFPDGMNTLPHQSSLKDSELASLINGSYSQYGTINKRLGSKIIGDTLGDSTSIIQLKDCYDIGGQDYFIGIGDNGKVYKYSFTNDNWTLLTATVPGWYAETDPEFVDDSPVFDVSYGYINIVQLGGKVYFANPNDRVVIFTGSTWQVYQELADPTTKPQVAKTGAGTGTRTYYYRYADLNEFGTTLASPANDGGQSNGDGFRESMPTIDGETYLTITLPAAPTGTTRRMLFRGDVAGKEFYLDDLEPDETSYVDKGTTQPSILFATPLANSTPGYHFYLLDTFKGSLVGTTVEEGKDILVWSAGSDKIDSFARPDGAGFDGYMRGEGQTINALQSFSVSNEDGLAVFKDSRAGLVYIDPDGGFDIRNINVIRGTMSPKSPHVSSKDIRFYSDEGPASIGHAENYGTILRYTVMGLKVNSITEQVQPANLKNVASAYFKNISYFAISTGSSGDPNTSILVYDERYDTWSHWTGLPASVFSKMKSPEASGRVERLYFGRSDAGQVVQMNVGKTDLATSTGSGNKINMILATKQYDAKMPDKFKKFDKAVLVFASLVGNQTKVTISKMGKDGIENEPTLRISTDPTSSGFGTQEWGTVMIGTMTDTDTGETLNIRYINLRQRDYFWVKMTLENDDTDGELSLLGIFFYYTDSARQLPGRSRIRTLA